ncbi:hypothetical protein H7F15_13480 [Pontibacter sp. Tf4]|uniref:MFS transporter n=1 Tax=Pontibacter sp. Tf4 TaxID=2761620 RepID=UPI00162787ED|nr:MFS transporter [Pontibacter sp. Tf4]MBB6612056.1 hypothetical protein [Pontibacter sp. Tf4]
MSRLTTTIVFTLSLLAVQAAAFTNYKLPELRQEYLAASNDEDAAKDFYAKMEKYSGNHAVILGYKAASEAVMAKYVWNPYFKMKHLKTAAGLFEEAIARDREEPEIRFLRFVVESHIPDYLNMSDNLEEDKAIVIKNLVKHPESGINTELARMMRDFLVAKDRCTEQEKQVLQKLKI